MFKNMLDLFVTGTPNSDGGTDFSLTVTSYILLIALILILLAIIFSTTRAEKKIKTKQLVFCSMAIALAMVASFIKFGSLPFGGSITLFSMLFICLIGYLYGTKVGLITGIAYGILQLLVDPYLFHPIQILLDFPIAFGCLGFSGLFSKSKSFGLIKGYVLGIIARYIMHVISGYIFFASYAPEGTDPLIHTLGYNATYIVPEAIGTIVILFLPPVIYGFSLVKRLANEA